MQYLRNHKTYKSYDRHNGRACTKGVCFTTFRWELCFLNLVLRISKSKSNRSPIYFSANLLLLFLRTIQYKEFQWFYCNHRALLCYCAQGKFRLWRANKLIYLIYLGNSYHNFCSERTQRYCPHILFSKVRSALLENSWLPYLITKLIKIAKCKVLFYETTNWISCCIFCTLNSLQKYRFKIQETWFGWFYLQIPKASWWQESNTKRH